MSTPAPWQWEEGRCGRRGVGVIECRQIRENPAAEGAAASCARVSRRRDARAYAGPESVLLTTGVGVVCRRAVCHRVSFR